MKTIFCKGSPANEDLYGAPDLDNRIEPIIRCGGEPFKSCYDLDEFFYRCQIVDPRRSVAGTVIGFIADGLVDDLGWEECSMLAHLAFDLGIAFNRPSLESDVAFWTMFPDGVAEAHTNRWKEPKLLAKHREAVRVLNNPFFHKDPNANERRLVEIAEDNGLRFALDRIDVLPQPAALAREIALLNHGLRDPENVEMVREKLTVSIAETMEDWGLEPTLRKARSEP